VSVNFCESIAVVIEAVIHHEPASPVLCFTNCMPSFEIHKVHECTSFVWCPEFYFFTQVSSCESYHTIKQIVFAPESVKSVVLLSSAIRLNTSETAVAVWVLKKNIFNTPDAAFCFVVRARERYINFVVISGVEFKASCHSVSWIDKRYFNSWPIPPVITNTISYYYCVWIIWIWIDIKACSHFHGAYHAPTTLREYSCCYRKD